MSAYTLVDYLHSIQWSERGRQRKGQFAYNVLRALRPDLSGKVNGTDHDPFYDDTRLPGFIAWLEENWDD